MKVIILAAGRGTQLGDLTAEYPKCLLPFGQETVLQREVRLVSKAGVSKRDIIVVVGYQDKKIPHDDYTIIVNKDYYKTDNAYSLYLALKDINEDVLILDGDLVFEEGVIDDILLRLGNYVICNQSLIEFGGTGVELDGSSNIVKKIGKHIANSPYQYAGIIKLSRPVIPQLVKELSKNFSSWYTVPLNNILDNNKFEIIISKSEIMGINTPFDYMHAKSHFGIENFQIMVTAASGFLGEKVYNILKRYYRVIGTRHSDAKSQLFSLDLSDYEKVKAFFELNKPQLVINCAGIASPEVCEDNRENAYQVNVEAVKVLCDVSSQYGCKVIHISTDYVFDGSSNDEYDIEDEPNPINYYGHTKAEAEKIVAAHPNNLIIRIPIIYGYNGPFDKETFPRRVLHSLQKGEKIYLDNRQIRFPVLTDEIAMMISKSLSERGIIHISSDESVTKYTWAKIIAKEFGYDEALICEDLSSDLKNRPPHTKLKLTSRKYLCSNVEQGTRILKRQMKCAFRLIYSTHPTEHIYGESVGRYRYFLGQKLGEKLPANIKREVSCIVPVPSSGLYYAMGISEITGIPYVQGLFKSDTRARSFQIASNATREKLINSKIEPIRELIEGKVIALVDEAIFSGTTLKVVCDMCKACNVQKIYIFIPTPPCYNRCDQYMRPEHDLLSAYVEEDKLKDHFKVSGVFFQSFKTFSKSLEKIPGICYECFEDSRGIGEC